MPTSVDDYLVKASKMEKSGIESKFILDFFDFRDALADGMPVYQDKDNPHHYKFDFFPVDQFNDCMMEEIAEALKESTKATEITLSHGEVTDEGMKKFIDALKETKAHIKSLHIAELWGVTDNSMKELVNVIGEKDIEKCELKYMKGVSKDVEQQIEKACKQQSTPKVKISFSDTKEMISTNKEKLEELYKRINPELAALREEEKNKIEKGMTPQQAQKERREAVKAYYNKKSPREC